MDQEELRKLAVDVGQMRQEQQRQGILLRDLEVVVFGDRNNLRERPGIERMINAMDERSKRNGKMLMAVLGTLLANLGWAIVKAASAHL